MDIEQKLIEKLIESGLLGKGEAKLEINAGIYTPKRIDLVFEKEEEVWIIEAKKILCYEALGQLLVYGDLYSLTTPKRVKLGVVCENSDYEIEWTCNLHGVVVFPLGEVPNLSWEYIEHRKGKLEELIKEDVGGTEAEAMKPVFSTHHMVPARKYPQTTHETEERICPSCKTRFIVDLDIEDKFFELLRRMQASMKAWGLTRQYCSDCAERTCGKFSPGKEIGFAIKINGTITERDLRDVGITGLKELRLLDKQYKRIVKENDV